MSATAEPEWGWDWHRRNQILAWGRATPAQRFAWLEETLMWVRDRPGRLLWPDDVEAERRRSPTT